MSALASLQRGATAWLAETPRLTVGLLNNMPDAALCATERQFAGLLAEAAHGVDIELRLFALPRVRRGPEACEHMAGRYERIAALTDGGLDGLIVTGLEPRAPDLEDEAFWPALAQLIDWTQGAGLPTVWSCLAAHAAVLRLSGVRRRPLPAKLSGVFASEAVSRDPLLAGAPATMLSPHSRLNGLAEAELADAGYEILTRSAAAGVDAFVGRGGAGPALFLQGHPEYDADTLAREYLRDVGRFLKGQRPQHPRPPTGYLDAETEGELCALAAASQAGRGLDRLALYGAVLEHAAPRQTWRASAVALYRNWLAELAAAAEGSRWTGRTFADPAA
ncbi:MAG TPA: homoserine O-succinyltransferase [Caulobacteraceae bacterium]|jgi:homoserine O-succinyltransferase